jgi:hypothetical protein
MNRIMLSVIALSTTLGAFVGTGHAESSLGDALRHRFERSRIEVQSASDEGRVVKKGTILVLQADQVPAAKLRVVQTNTKSPRFHSPHYARVEVSRDGHLIANPSELSLPRGTRIAVLDVRVSHDQVRLFTHTVDPVRLTDGTAAHGCTEFVFAIDPATRAHADVEAVASRIDRWLAITPAN